MLARVETCLSLMFASVQYRIIFSYFTHTYISAPEIHTRNEGTQSTATHYVLMMILQVNVGLLVTPLALMYRRF